MIRAVTFDFWGTLYTEAGRGPRRQGLREQYAREFLIAQGHGVSEQKMGLAFDVLWRQAQHLRVVEHHGMDAEELGGLLAQIVGAPLDGDQARKLGEAVSAAGLEEPPSLVEGARRVLEKLHRQVKLAVICDAIVVLGADLYRIMENDGIAQLMSHFTFSDQTGTTKPEVRQFLYTLHRLDVRPEEAVHVGDLEEADVAGALAAGMRTIRLLRPDKDARTLAHAAVRSIRDVPTVLEDWGLEL